MDLDSKAYSKLIDAWNTHGGSEDYRRILERLGPLTKRHDHETPEMWCSCIRDPFRKILEENYSSGNRILSKNGYIEIVCDSLVFIPYTSLNVRIYQDNHLKRCISGNSILNEHSRRKEILKSIDRREFQIWQYKQYILQEEANIKHFQLELLSQSTLHLEKDKLASVLYDHDANFTASYENYAQSKAKDTMPSAPNFEPAYIPPARQEMVSPISHQSKAVRNDGTPDEKKFLGINNEWGYSNPSGQIYDEDGYCCPAKNDWIIEKRYQLWIRLANVTHILVYKILYQQGYIVVRGAH
ncbi:hypothetical protein GLOIN_2v1781605 [Rhizophagus irregularis DAOM 181602=DAOM 197198]|uniref:Uncharacterized protein n=1 Tax=Rhizophagus irregularis (strain DAOM 181602 / DAOM 197198 / MUCL 43194) TaxID=747089 RepID=A0A2P4PJK8_RHIID|nr:hypothetical protein GLOIN_2v1781605 [Rhizophagus irregularis DAOM 181602=DAOM 197198]POG65547.1 hypothetical protein GLOIN_2v1781605 [Rhizophagus irregularis DAOM 181602=DAOM 197198]GBC51214.2 hypothetical protein GLOIN_2v1781605 [Rhizophagus irregularis DAOM 181602=DAOM 197198]|eukprot:XP_025172413.1 hypothetical protein GLOIN_2v1781605 [Rhizophagus irregularis DAOM 181602=DAOM 197198]